MPIWTAAFCAGCDERRLKSTSALLRMLVSQV